MCVDCVSIQNYSRQCQMLAVKYGLSNEAIRHINWSRPYHDMMDPEDAVKQFVGNLGHAVCELVRERANGVR